MYNKKKHFDLVSKQNECSFTAGQLILDPYQCM